MPTLSKAGRKAECPGQLFDDEIYLKIGSAKARKCFRKDDENWEIDRTRLQELQKLLKLNLPQHTVEVLSKLIINHQIVKIGQVTEVSASHITIKAKVNLQKEIFKDLSSDDVRMKIFTKKNHTRRDLEAAKSFRLYANKKVVIHWSEHRKSACFEVKENMVVHRIDSIVFIDTRTAAKPAYSMKQIIRNDLEQAVDHYSALLVLIKKLKAQDSNFWTQPADMHNIFYHDSEWKIVEHKSELAHSTKSFGNFVENINSMTKVFVKHGVPMQKMFTPCYQHFWDVRHPHGFNHKIALELLKRFSKNPCSTLMHGKK